MDIKNYILNKYLDIDEILLNYLITYFNYIDTYNLYPSNILLTDIIDTTLTNVRHIIFFDKDSEIVLISKNGEEERHTVSELCPYPFDETDL